MLFLTDFSELFMNLCSGLIMNHENVCSYLCDDPIARQKLGFSARDRCDAAIDAVKVHLENQQAVGNARSEPSKNHRVSG